MEQPMAQGTGDTRDSSGANPGTIRGVATCAGLGGLFLTAYAVSMALKPPGSVTGYRQTGLLDLILLLAALGLMSAVAVGLFRLHRFDGRGTRIVRIAALVDAVSPLILVLGIVIMAVFYQGDSSLVYLLVITPGLLLAVLGFAVTGAGLMRSRILPPWSGAMLILATLLMFATTNTQDARILFVIPFGVTWMVLGGLLWSTAASPASRWHAHIQHA